MATTDYDFELNRNQIIQGALRKIGVLGQGQQMSGEMLADGKEALNVLMKEWDGRNVGLWRITQQSFSTVAATASYTEGNEVIAVDKAWYNDGTDDIPLRVLSYRQYLDIPDKTEQGRPLAIATDHGRSTPTVYVWPTPDAVYTIKLETLIRLQDLDTATSTPVIPQRFIGALIYELAAELAPEYGISVGEQKWLRTVGAGKFTIQKASDTEHHDDEDVDGAFCDGAY